MFFLNMTNIDCLLVYYVYERDLYHLPVLLLKQFSKNIAYAGEYFSWL